MEVSELARSGKCPRNELSRYMSFEERLQSLEKWPPRNLFNSKALEEIAHAGFFYQFSEDSPMRTDLRCDYCNLCVGEWKPTDNPWQVHITILPRCLHVITSVGTKEIYRILDRENEDFCHDGLSSPYPGEITRRQRNSCTPQLFGIRGPLVRSPQNSSRGPNQGPEASTTYRTYGGRKFHKPRVQNMSCCASRRQTLDRLGLALGEKTDNLAESGLFHSGTSGNDLECYYCMMRFPLAQLISGNDPWTDHARASDCFHLIMTKGETFVEQARGNINAYKPAVHQELQDTQRRKRKRDEEEDSNDTETEDGYRQRKRARDTGVSERESGATRSGGAAYKPYTDVGVTSYSSPVVFLYRR